MRLIVLISLITGLSVQWSTYADVLSALCNRLSGFTEFANGNEAVEGQPMDKDEIANLQENADNAIDCIAENDENIDSVLHITASTPLGERQGDILSVMNDNQQLEYFVIKPDKVAKENAWKRRIFGTDLLNELRPDELRSVLETDLPKNDWILLGKSDLDPTKGGTVRMRIQNTGGKPIPLRIKMPDGTFKSETINGDLLIQVRKELVAGKDQITLYYNDQRFDNLHLDIVTSLLYVATIKELVLSQK